MIVSIFILTRGPSSVTSVRRELLFVGLLIPRIQTTHSLTPTVSLPLLHNL